MQNITYHLGLEGHSAIQFVLESQQSFIANLTSCRSITQPLIIIMYTISMQLKFVLITSHTSQMVWTKHSECTSWTWHGCRRPYLAPACG